MTDISTIAATFIRRADATPQAVPRLPIAASFWAKFGLVGDAYRMAYVDPYTSLRRQPQIIPDDDLKGRDPSW